MSKSVAEMRIELVGLLERWSTGELSSGEVHNLAEVLLEQYNWEGAPKSDPTSIVNEVLAQLDILNQQLIVDGDIPAILKFLAAAPGTEPQAWQSWENYWEGIDMDERRDSLKGNPYYFN